MRACLLGRPAPVFFLLALVALVSLTSLASSTSVVHAQSGTPAELFVEQACRDDPNSEQCICGFAAEQSLYPAIWDVPPGPGVPGTARDYIDSPVNIVVDFVDGKWRGSLSSKPMGYQPEMDHDGDLVVLLDEFYNQRCSLSYFRESLHRRWYVAVAVGGLFFAVSIGWLGFVYMQETSSGGDLARVRAMFFRVGMGLLLLTLAFVAFEAFSDFLLWDLDRFSVNRSEFFYWERR